MSEEQPATSEMKPPTIIEIHEVIAYAKAMVMQHPKSRELSLAVTKLDEAALWMQAHAAKETLREAMSAGKDNIAAVRDVINKAHAEVMEVVNAHDPKPSA